MIETYCRPNIFDQCKKAVGQRPICWLKGEKEPIWEWEQFFHGMSGFSVIWHGQREQRKISLNDTYRQAVRLMSINGEKICQGWINDKFNGDWLKAMRKFDNFDAMFNGFSDYFGERRKAIMDKTNDIISKLNPQLAKTGQIRTNSHGGVANLLKVLTKTMHEQGSSIKTIAKVQYAVCTQAGIYIPDEFITDVIVAVNMSPTNIE